MLVVVISETFVSLFTEVLYLLLLLSIGLTFMGAQIMFTVLLIYWVKYQSLYEAGQKREKKKNFEVWRTNKR